MKTDKGKDKFKIEFEKGKEKLNIEISLQKKEDEKKEGLLIFIKRENSIPSTYYKKVFSLDDLKNLSDYCHMFKSIEKAFQDFKFKSERKDYDINLDNSDNEIVINIQTYTVYGNLSLVIPVAQMDQEKVVRSLCNIIKKHDEKISELSKIKEPENINAQNINKLEERIKILEDKNKEIIQTFDEFKLKYDKDDILFKDSKIIKNIYERKIIESFIKKNDSNKSFIYPTLIYRATDDGDSSNDFHKKCDNMGATLIIVESENGRRFGGYTSESWNKNKGSYSSSGNNFLFSLDTRKYYTNSSGYYTYHHGSYGPSFGESANQDLCISSGCLNNNKSYNKQSYYNMNESYELSLSQTFKVKDYEVFQI